MSKSNNSIVIRTAPLHGTRISESDQGALWDKPRLAKFLKVSKPTVDQWVSKGRGGPRHLKIGALVRFRPEDVFDYLESCARGGTAGAA